MQSYWAALAIGPTNDVATIKRAYAAKLKVTRPDEHPEAFQRLHQAYKWALNRAARQHQAEVELVTDSAFGSGETLRPNDSTASTDSTDQTDFCPPPMVDQELPARTAEKLRLEAEVQRLLVLVDEALSQFGLAGSLSQWRFLSESPDILDSAFNWSLGAAVLERIADHRLNCTRRRRRHRGSGSHVNAEIITLLNTVFNWLQYRSELVALLGAARVDAVLPYVREIDRSEQLALSGVRGGKNIRRVDVHKVNGPITWIHAGMPKRILAVVIDLFVIAIPAALVLSLAKLVLSEPVAGTLSDHSAMLSVVYYMVYAWICECSDAGATVGKKLLGLKVFNGKLQRLGYLHGLLRMAAFGLSCVFSYLTFLINLRMQGDLIHDRLTRSKVIDVRKSKRQHFGG